MLSDGLFDRLNIEIAALVGGGDHAGGYGVVAGFINQDKGAGGGVFGIGGGGERLLQGKAEAADVVDGELFGGFHVAQCVHIPHIGDLLHFGGSGLRAMFEQVFALRVERALVKPAQRCLDVAGGQGGIVGGQNAVAA